MAERKIKLPIGPVLVDATEVSIVGRQDGLIEYVLEDGATIRIAIAPTQILRMDGTHDGDGLPIYFVKHGTVVNTISAPDNLKKK